MMRRILVEFAGNRQRQKRGGGAVRVNLDDVQELPDSNERDLVALSDALSGLAMFDPRMGKVVELRFFGGLTGEETADVLNVSPETVVRDWKTAKAWRLGQIRRGNHTVRSLRHETCRVFFVVALSDSSGWNVTPLRSRASETRRRDSSWRCCCTRKVASPAAGERFR